MKTKLFFLNILFFSVSTFMNAQVVALHKTDGVQLFNGTNAFVAACNASVANDTIYLSGNGFTANLTLNKRLLIYGSGHYPDSTEVTGKSILNGYITLSENADGFYLEGVDLTSSLTTTSNHAVDNLTIKYSRIEGELQINGNASNPANNLLLINSVVQGRFLLQNAQNAGVFNNIFNSYVDYSYGNLFENNIFLINSHGISRSDNNLLQNNIIVGTSSYTFVNDGNSNVLKNNLFVDATPAWGSTPTLVNNYIGIAQAAIFISQTGYAFDYTHNYHLQAPETYLGVDGTQVGLYGGAYPYKEGAVPSNPHFMSATIAPQSDAGGNLNIVIKAGAQER